MSLMSPREPACRACRGCGLSSAFPQTAVENTEQEEAALRLHQNDLYRLLWHSWLKPLSFAVLASILCMSFSVGEPMTVLLVMLAFGTGFLTCREQQGPLFRAEGVSRVLAEVENG